MTSLFKTKQKETNQSNQYGLKDKNNEDILIIFKNNSIINNSEIYKEIPINPC